LFYKDQNPPISKKIEADENMHEDSSDEEFKDALFIPEPT
jgi:hypothetical protein